MISTIQPLLPEDTNGKDDIYLKDLSTGDLTLLSKSASGALGNGDSNRASISADGSTITFETTASNISPGASATDPHIVSLNVATGAIGLLWDDTTGDAQFEVSPDGTTLALDTTDQLTAAGAGNAEGIYTIHFTVPKLTIDPITGDNLVNVADGPTITISGTSDAIGQIVNLTLPGSPGSAPLGTATVNPDGTWRTSVAASSFADGAYDVRAFVTDGLTTHVDEPIQVDRTPPQDVTITSVAGDDIINAAELAHVEVDGGFFLDDPLAAAGADIQDQLQIKIDDVPITSFSVDHFGATQEGFSTDIDASGFADGKHTVTLTVTDEAGNTTSVTQDVLIDTTPPKIAITSVSGDDVVDSSEIKSAQDVHGTSNAIGQTVDVLIDGAEAGQALVQADGTWVTSVSFANTVSGNHDVTAQVSDKAGNPPGRADVDVYVDTGFAVTQLSDGPNGEQGGGQGVQFPGLSADGTKLIFTGLNFDLMSSATGSSGAQVYIKDLTTGAISFATPDSSDNAEFGAISQDGTKIVFVSNASLDPANQALNGDGPGYYTYEESLSDGVPHIRVFDSQTPDNLNPSSALPAGDHLAQPLPVFPLAIANNGYDSEGVETTNIDQSGTVDLFENFEVDGSVDASGQPTVPYNQLGFLLPPIPSDIGTFQLYAPEFSADGSVAAFEARFHAEQPTGTQPCPNTQIYAGAISPSSFHVPLASSFSDGTPMPFGAIDPALSADGKFVAFWSWGTDGAPEVYVKNLATGELKVASSDASGNAGVDNASGTFNAGFNTIAISADGRYVAFTSDAILTPDDSGTGADLFVKDMQTGAIERVALPAGTFADDLSSQLTMRADGQYIAFTTSAALSPMDTNGTTDIYGVSLASLGPSPHIAIDPVTGDDKINAAEDSKNVAVTGTSDDLGGTVTLVVDGNAQPTVVVGTDGTWSTTIDATQLIDGVHQLRATVTNTDGATGSAGDLVTVDTVAPTVQLSADKTHLTTGETATITASFSEGIGNIASDFLTSADGTFDHVQLVDDHTLTAIFTAGPDVGAFDIQAEPDTAFDFAGNPNAQGADLSIACYCRGTLIATGRGEVTVEDLAIGDRVITPSGPRPIKWIGTRSYRGRFILGRKDVLPICLTAGSLGEGLPRRDLWISPHHAMYLDGVLIEARDLVNGVSVIQAETVDRVEYFHIELDSHDVILAEGTWSETFADDDSRGMFHNAQEYSALYPDTERAAARYCARRCAEGYEVEAVRRSIDARAGLQPAGAEAPASLRGYVDVANDGRIAGWAQNTEHPEAPVCLDIFAGGRLIGQTLANRLRDDLARAGLGNGRQGFEFTPPRGLTVAPSAIEVRRSIDGTRLAFSAGAERRGAGVAQRAA